MPDVSVNIAVPGGAGDACVIGIDFGTLSGRALVVRALRDRAGGEPAGAPR
jgi:hypothetical protein